MKQQTSLISYLLISAGVYFLLRELQIPFFETYHSWTILLIMIGSGLLIYSYTSKDYQHLFTGAVILGYGIHTFGRFNYEFWIEHSAINLLIIGIGIILRATRTRLGYVEGTAIIVLAVLLIFAERLTGSFSWVLHLSMLMENFWPVLIIGIGLLWLKRK